MRDLEIYLDMDGVCTDFISAALAAHDYDPEPTLERWARDHPGEFFPYAVMDIEMEQFWAPLADLGEQFWAGLRAYDWFDHLFEQLTELGHVVFLTSPAPTIASSCVAGKVRWLQDRYGAEFQDFIFTAHKDRLAHENAVLIDDYDLNVARFKERGGHGIVFPQFWNEGADVDDSVSYVLSEVRSRFDRPRVASIAASANARA